MALGAILSDGSRRDALAEFSFLPEEIAEFQATCIVGAPWVTQQELPAEWHRVLGNWCSCGWFEVAGDGARAFPSVGACPGTPHADSVFNLVFVILQ